MHKKVQFPGQFFICFYLLVWDHFNPNSNFGTIQMIQIWTTSQYKSWFISSLPLLWRLYVAQGSILTWGGRSGNVQWSIILFTVDGSWTWTSIPVTLKLLSVKMTLSTGLTYVTSCCSLEFGLEIPYQLISPLILLRTYITPLC